MKISAELRKDDNLHGGKVISGSLTIILNKPKKIQHLYFNFDSEIATRGRIRRENADGQRWEELETNKEWPFFMKFIIADFTIEGELFLEGTHTFPFSLPLPKMLPGSIQGPPCNLRVTGKQLKYEINYRLQPGLTTAENKVHEGEKLSLRIQETPELTDFDPCFQLSGTQRFRKEFTGFFGQSKGAVHATIVLKKLHVECGEDFEVPICLRNDSDKEFSGFRLELVQQIHYDVNGVKKECSEVAAAQKVDISLAEVMGGEKVVMAKIHIPENIPASTPGYRRKINVEYSLWIKMLNKSAIDDDLEVLKQKILVSSFPWY